MAHKFKTLSDPILADPCERAKIEQLKRASLDAVELTRLREARDMTYQEVAETLESRRQTSRGSSTRTTSTSRH